MTAPATSCHAATTPAISAPSMTYGRHTACDPAVCKLCTAVETATATPSPTTTGVCQRALTVPARRVGRRSRVSSQPPEDHRRRSRRQVPVRVRALRGTGVHAHLDPRLPDQQMVGQEVRVVTQPGYLRLGRMVLPEPLLRGGLELDGQPRPRQLPLAVPYGRVRPQVRIHRTNRLPTGQRAHLRP